MLSGYKLSYMSLTFVRHHAIAKHCSTHELSHRQPYGHLYEEYHEKRQNKA